MNEMLGVSNIKNEKYMASMNVNLINNVNHEEILKNVYIALSYLPNKEP
jgi:hypothetical protein